MRLMKPMTGTRFTRLHADDGQAIADQTNEATDLYRDGMARYVLRGWPCSGRYMTTFWPLAAKSAARPAVMATAAVGVTK